MRLFEETRPATLEDVSWLRRAVRRQMLSLRIADELVNDIQLAVAELATNAVKHPDPAPNRLTLRIDLIGATLRLQLDDDGAPFLAFEQTWAAAGRKDLAATGPSGLGLALAQSLLYQVSYTVGPPNRLVGWRPLAYRRPAILLVEDENTLRRIYTHMLKDHYRIYPAATVEEALAIAATRRLDLVVTDFHIGPDPATRLMAELERDAQRLPIPVIVQSGDPADATRARAEGFGVEQFLKKPIKAADLQSAIGRALAASHRRLTGMLRHFGASVERLLAMPSAADLARLGMSRCGAGATAGSGDFVLHLPGSDRERIVLADVMGHGLQANAGAIAFAATLRSVHAMTPSPKEAARAGNFLAAVSRVMQVDESLASMFVTVLVIDRLADGTLELASAGHPPPVLASSSGVQMLDIGGPLLGVFAGYEYLTLAVQPGERERIVVVTDGIEPLLAAAGGALPEGLLDAVRSTLDEPIEKAIAAAEDWAERTLGPSPRDDWTVMLLEARPLPPSAPPGDTHPR